MKIKTQSSGGGHSWGVDSRPADTFPGDPKRGRYLVREFRHELVEAGALARIGRQLVVFGGPYRRWLERRGARERVLGFEISANRDRHSDVAA